MPLLLVKPDLSCLMLWRAPFHVLRDLQPLRAYLSVRASRQLFLRESPLFACGSGSTSAVLISLRAAATKASVHGWIVQAVEAEAER